jgi:hypothetical protein
MIKKVLLLGDFSGFHKNLKEGLEKEGVETLLVADGDGFKKIPADVIIPKYKGVLGLIIYRLVLLSKIYQFRGYDVVQVMSLSFIPNKLFPSYYFVNFLKKHNKKVFLVAAGTDCAYWNIARKKLKYGPFNDVVKYDDPKQGEYYQDSSLVTKQYSLASMFDGIIPIMYDYEVAYSDFSNVCKTIPMPINTDSIEYKENFVEDKIVVFHGLNREGFKGTHYVREAFDLLSKKYPDKLELIIDGKMEYNKYLEVLSRVNIIIDQTNSYSLGVNGVLSLAMGKVVLGGAEIESLASFGVESSPIINIRPSSEAIVEAVESLIKSS